MKLCSTIKNRAIFKKTRYLFLGGKILHEVYIVLLKTSVCLNCPLVLTGFISVSHYLMHSKSSEKQ